jgi:hypothetical protein
MILKVTAIAFAEKYSFIYIRVKKGTVYYNFQRMIYPFEADE